MKRPRTNQHGRKWHSILVTPVAFERTAIAPSRFRSVGRSPMKGATSDASAGWSARFEDLVRRNDRANDRPQGEMKACRTYRQSGANELDSCNNAGRCSITSPGDPTPDSPCRPEQLDRNSLGARTGIPRSGPGNRNSGKPRPYAVCANPVTGDTTQWSRARGIRSSRCHSRAADIYATDNHARAG